MDVSFYSQFPFALPRKYLRVVKIQGEINGPSAKNSISPLESANFSSSIRSPHFMFIVGNQLTP
jgi:hypothetical protein